MRLIDVNAFIEKYCKDCGYGCKAEEGMVCATVDDLKKFPVADAIAMPKGRPGDVVEWNNGVEPYEPQYYMIMGIYINGDSVRYDLGSFSPVVDHKNIVRIIPFDGTPPDGTKTLTVKIPKPEIHSYGERSGEDATD